MLACAKLRSGEVSDMASHKQRNHGNIFHGCEQDFHLK